MEASYLFDTEECLRVMDALTRVGDKWSVLVVIQLGLGARRFNELRRAIGGVSQKMLALTLRGLERDGFITRTVYATKPPSVEYALTVLGREMVVPVRTLGTWVLDNLHRIEIARRNFDAEAEQA